MNEKLNCRVYMNVMLNVAISVDADNEEKAIEMIQNMPQKELLRSKHILSVSNIEVRTVNTPQKRVIV
ncbi:hypothetical protein B9Z35_07290 [Limnohabitans sp. Jir61]|uniref:hypothetical protein n=1 Tax=Limnohabitans sp. Jir61 TaxID=1826168 RepID=UPI000D392B15|nr:hypothetical protein [Limnohabitans sp. Jir61]PUE30848.1 hypothetical protein B9Z35_07290 [Limnohabitans sp. Jir61]